MGILERQIREEEILEAAAKVFFAKGFGSAKMSDIAREAKLSKGLVYFYYKSKEDLYMAVIYQACKLNVEFHKEILEKKKDGTALEKGLFLLRSYFLFGKKYPFFQEALSNYISIMNPAKQIAGNELVRRFKESPYYTKILELQTQPLMLLSDLLNEGIKEGSVKTKLNPVFLYMSIWSLMIGYEKLSIPNNLSDKTDFDTPFFLLDNEKWQQTIMKIVEIVLTTEGPTNKTEL